MAFYGPSSSLMIDSDGIVLSGFDSSSSDNTTLVARIRRTWSLSDNSNFAEPRTYALGMGKILAGDMLDSTGGHEYTGRVRVYDYEGNLIDSVPDPRDYLTGSNKENAQWGDRIAYGNGRFVIAAGSGLSGAYDEANKIKQRLWIYDNDLNLIKSVAASDSNGIGNYTNLPAHIEFGIMNSKLYVYDTFYDSDNAANVYPYEGRILRFDLFNEDSTEELVISNPLPNIYGNFAGAIPFGGETCIGHNRLLWTEDAYDSASNNNAGRALLFDQDGKLLREIQSPTSVSNRAFFGYQKAIGCGRIAIGSFTGFSGNKGTIHVYDLNGEQLWQKSPSDIGITEDGWGRWGLHISNDKIFIGGYANGGGISNVLGALYIFDLDGNYLETYRPDNLGASTSFAQYQFNYDGSNSYGNIFAVAADLDSSGTNTSPTGVRQESIFVLKTGNESYSEYMNKVFDLKR